MIKETLIQLSHELNRLDPDSDTLMLIDWSSRTVVLSQRANEQFISNHFWVLLEPIKEEGKSFDMISSEKLKSIKLVLLRVINNFTMMEVVPEPYGFRVKRFYESIYHGKVMNNWITETKFSFKNNIFMKMALFLLSKEYRRLRKSLLKVKIE